MNENPFEKNKENPKLAHILSLFENKVMAAFINGHLILEYLIVQLILLKDNSFEKVHKMNFPDKLKKCQSLDIFNQKMCDYLNAINKIRNNYAHNLGYVINFDELFLLVQMASEAGIDFSDETIYLNKNLSEECYGEYGIIQEVFQNTALDFAFIVEELGGEFQM